MKLTLLMQHLAGGLKATCNYLGSGSDPGADPDTLGHMEQRSSVYRLLNLPCRTSHHFPFPRNRHVELFRAATNLSA